MIEISMSNQIIGNICVTFYYSKSFFLAFFVLFFYMMTVSEKQYEMPFMDAHHFEGKKTIQYKIYSGNAYFFLLHSGLPYIHECFSFYVQGMK